MSGRFKGLTVEYQKGKDKMNFEDTKKFTESVLKYGTSLDNANKVMDEAIGSVLMKSHRKAAELDKLEIQFKSLTDKGIKEVLQLVTQYGLPGEVETIEYSRKEKLPRVLANFVEELKKTNKRYGIVLEDTFQNTKDSDLANYLEMNKNIEKVFNAISNGYEVEEEPKYRIACTDGYLSFIRFSSSVWEIETSSKSENAIVISSREKAEQVAKVANGTVVDW